MSLRECDRCHSNRKNTKIRCKSRTCKIAKKCWRHLKSEDGLVVKKSTIKGAGMGLFAAVNFKKGKILGSYKADLPFLTEKQLQALEKNPDHRAGAYVMCGRSRKCIDAKSTQSQVVRFSNACDFSSKGHHKCNAKLTEQFNLRALKDIKAGSEIFCKYGGEYWGRAVRRKRN